MPITDAFLATCRSAVSALPELTTFRTALSTLTATNRAARYAAWTAAYDNSASGQSPAYRLRAAIRGVVRAQADLAGNVTPLERESAYRTLASEFAPAVSRPPTAAEERTELERLRLEGLTA